MTPVVLPPGDHPLAFDVDVLLVPGAVLALDDDLGRARAPPRSPLVVPQLHLSEQRLARASAASSVSTAGSGSYSTSTASDRLPGREPRRRRTSATGSPTCRTTPSASIGQPSSRSWMPLAGRSAAVMQTRRRRADATTRDAGVRMRAAHGRAEHHSRIDQVVDVPRLPGHLGEAVGTRRARSDRGSRRVPIAAAGMEWADSSRRCAALRSVS